jgi:dynein light chain 1
MAQKATTIKEAIKRFEERYRCNAAEATEVHLEFQWPPIEKMDPQLGTLTRCE